MRIALDATNTEVALFSTIVIGGYIHTERAQTHSGVTIAAEAKTALKNVVFC